jgi:DNA-binding HxlR family transcriptional regulator
MLGRPCALDAPSEAEEGSMSRQDQLGVRALKLLAEESMVAVLGGLADGALRPAELEQRLPSAGHSLVMRRLRHLLDAELVTHEHRPGQPPRARSAGTPHQAHYNLTAAGQMLLEVIAAAGRWEDTWSSRDERREGAGTLAIELTADEHMRNITLLLADGPLCTKDLDGLTSDLGRSALRRRLRELVLAGLLERRNRGRAPLYELTAGARHLALVAMLAGRWEWQWSRPRRQAPGRDLDELMHMLAPVAHIPEPLAGTCQLHLDTRGADDPDIYLAARAGNVLALAGAPATPPEAVGHATPEVWCDALLRRERRITVSGNQPLLAGVIAALSTALLG